MCVCWLDLNIKVGQLLLRWDDAHIDVLLMGGSDLLLLLLQEFNLLRKCELLDYRGQ